jgi:hypothetical protein
VAQIDFHVEGLPPKKDGASSMWGKDSERPRIQALRRAAFERFGGQPPLRTDITLTLELHIAGDRIASAGDLDNFITGVCDALMAANGVHWHSHVFAEPSWEGIQPDHAVAIQDDAEVVAITASKLPSTVGHDWYRVVLTGS